MDNNVYLELECTHWHCNICHKCCNKYEFVTRDRCKECYEKVPAYKLDSEKLVSKCKDCCSITSTHCVCPRCNRSFCTNHMVKLYTNAPRLCIICDEKERISLSDCHDCNSLTKFHAGCHVCRRYYCVKHMHGTEKGKPICKFCAAYPFRRNGNG